MLAKRRALLQAGATLLAGSPWLAWAQKRVPIADMHSHYGMITRKMADSGLADDMRENGVALVAWKVIADGRWIKAGRAGIEQVKVPEPGELLKFFQFVMGHLNTYVSAHKLRKVLTPADVDASVAGDPGIVLASEGADFVEGRLENLDVAYGLGLRHLQLVHYIRTPVGDSQTERPVHSGLSELGKRLVEACNAKGLLVDLAHSSAPALDQALEISKAPLIWSHGWVDADGGQWQDPYGFLQRRLSLASAKKIAAKGGVVGLWALGLQRPSHGWNVAPGNQASYARALAELVNKLGADHVAMGTDIEGVGPGWALNSYAHVRSVVGLLEQAKLDSATIEKVAYANYARVLKAALKA
jgi:membrane dipeptidase